MSEFVIETSNLTKKYKNHVVVNQLNMRVRKGEIYGFLGPNGAGKTTTIRMLLGLIRPTEGEVKIFGKDLTQHRMSILAKVGSLVETPTYYGHLTGYENLEVARRLLRIDDEKCIDEVLSIVRLTKAKDKKVKEYSLGMKQRLGIATALLNKPELLILDEPTNGLDPEGIREIRELIKQLPKEYEMTVMISSHLLNEVEQIATEVGIIHQGNLIFQDHIDALRRQSQARLCISTDKPEEAAEFLKEQGIEVIREEQDERLYLTDSAPEAAGKINRLLVEKGFLVYRLEERKRSLEDIFLDLTKEGESL
ncbi:ABC transporter ATP-binding protein [Thermoflavimicrobium dichotomicum]|uniref:ABC-2 type transport system ATP-binding protein n=1 Tax=Thermoflavimicrobium dichotomicum TaxID=46223 RepID=A0A1I3SKW7_9BACL|nr:ABC transporter ATP-binding protein [Thermoflavimicrobium dichotomicum]SFJ59414.1 ABC-2 type transport system ATP-binding protein [Thermoflavimicrobium dichotomicum]